MPLAAGCQGYPAGLSRERKGGRGHKESWWRQRDREEKQTDRETQREADRETPFYTVALPIERMFLSTNRSGKN